MPGIIAWLRKRKQRRLEAVTPIEDPVQIASSQPSKSDTPIAREGGSYVVDFRRLDIHPADYCARYQIAVDPDTTLVAFLNLLAIDHLPGCGLYEWTIRMDGGKVIGKVGGPEGTVCETPDATLQSLGVTRVGCVPEALPYLPS